MLRKSSFLALAVVVTLPLKFAIAAGTGAIDLVSAYQAALQYDAKLAAAKSSLESDQETVGLALAGLLPKIDASANGGYNRSSIEYSQSGGAFTDKTTPFYQTFGYGIQLSQPIYRKTNFEAFGQSFVVKEQGELRYHLAEQDLMLRVAQAYFDVLSAQNNVELSDIELQATGKQLERAKKALDVGTATITEVYDAQARYDLTQARAIAAKNQLDLAQQALTRVIGSTPAKHSRLRGEFPLSSPEPNDVESWKKVASTESLQVRTAKNAVTIAKYELEKQIGQAYPTLDFVASYDNNYSEDSTLGGGRTSDSVNVAVRAAIPLYAGGAVSVRKRQLLADKTKAEHLLTDAERETDLATQQAFSAIVSGIEQIKALQQVEKSSQSSLDSTQKGFELGLRTMIDVLNAQQQLFAAKRDLAAAKYQYLVNRLKLKAAVGQLAEGDINVINAYLSEQSK